MNILVKNKELVSKTILLELDLSLELEGKEHALGVSVTYEYLPDWCQVEILTEVVRGDDSFLENNEELREQLGEFVNNYVTENIREF